MDTSLHFEFQNLHAMYNLPQHDGGFLIFSRDCFRKPCLDPDTMKYTITRVDRWGKKTGTLNVSGYRCYNIPSMRAHFFEDWRRRICVIIVCAVGSNYTQLSLTTFCFELRDLDWII